MDVEWVNVMELGNKPTKGVLLTALIEYLYVLLEYLDLL